MNKIDIEKLGVAELSQEELCSVNGGSDFTKFLAETAGFIAGSIANAAAYCVKVMESTQGSGWLVVHH